MFENLSVGSNAPAFPSYLAGREWSVRVLALMRKATGTLWFDAAFIRALASRIPFKCGFAKSLHIGKVLKPTHG